MAKDKPKIGRPSLVELSTIVAIAGDTSKTVLHPNSDRRAMINRLTDLGGRATVAELEALFGYDIRPLVNALRDNGWITTHEPGTITLPRRTKSMGIDS